MGRGEEKDLKLSEIEVRALRRLLGKHVVAMSGVTQAIYISPAQQLRNQADEIEQDERDFPILQGIFNRL